MQLFRVATTKLGSVQTAAVEYAAPLARLTAEARPGIATRGYFLASQSAGSCSNRHMADRDQNEAGEPVESSKRFSPWFWVSFAAALLVLYVLSVGPAGAYSKKRGS